MAYGELLSRAWDIVWKHKFLILLGVLVAVGSGGGQASTGGSVVSNATSDSGPRLPGCLPVPRSRSWRFSWDRGHCGRTGHLGDINHCPRWADRRREHV